MMNYKIVNYTANIATPQALFVDLLETSTNQVIKSGMPQIAAKDLCRFLNMGGGFDGWTPAFFMHTIRISDSVEDDQ